MRSRAYAAYLFKCHAGLGLFSVLLAAGLQLIILGLTSSMDYAAVFEDMIDQLPPFMQQIISQQFLTTFTLGGITALGLTHPILMTIILLNAVLLPSRRLAGEIEAGVMEGLAALPVPRRRLVTMIWASIAAYLLGLCLATGAGSLLGIAVYHKLTPSLAGQVILITLELWLLALAVAGVALLIACMSRDGGRAGVITAAIFLTFYMLHFLSVFWRFLQPLQVLNVFYYYDPRQVLLSAGDCLPSAVALAAVALVTFLLARYRFQRRDIPG
jgi:ABC-type transport system involved in multi-copper enzyme maturation permease subunit